MNSTNCSLPVKKSRNSNLELYRIIVMLLIVAHHYVVNSGLTLSDGPIYSESFSWRSVFIFIFGAFGKTGINCFVFITGYFMCKSQISAKKFAKLFLEVAFYRVVIYIIFLLTGYETLSRESLIKLLPVNAIGNNFTGTFLIFFLCIPFINILVRNMTQKQHILLLALASFTYILLGTVRRVTMNYVTWFIVLYLIASFIRLYPRKIFDNTKLWGLLSLASILLSACSVIFCARFMKGFSPYFFVTDSNTLLAVITAVCSFLFFKNVKIKNSKFINTVSASTFGVLLIHSNSEAMRTWLWKTVLKTTDFYSSQFLILHAVCSVIGIFIVCVFIDFLRIKLIETPFFKLWDSHWESILKKYHSLEDKICKKININS